MGHATFCHGSMIAIWTMQVVREGFTDKVAWSKDFSGVEEQPGEAVCWEGVCNSETSQAGAWARGPGMRSEKEQRRGPAGFWRLFLELLMVSLQPLVTCRAGIIYKVDVFIFIHVFTFIVPGSKKQEIELMRQSVFIVCLLGMCMCVPSLFWHWANGWLDLLSFSAVYWSLEHTKEDIVLNIYHALNLCSCSI